MKYKNKLKNLATRQAAYDRLKGAEQAANTRPGSEKK